MNPSQQPKESIASEKAEILKATSLLKTAPFTNAGNQVFARTQSTPLEDQKPASLSLKERLAQKKKTNVTQEFKPTADSGAAAGEFLKSTSSKLSSNAQAFLPENYQSKADITATKTISGTSATTTSTTTGTTTTSATTTGTTTGATTGATTGTTTGTTAGTTAGAEKKKLKLSSSSFPFSGGQSTTTVKPPVNEERKTEKNEKLALSTDKINKPTPKKVALEDIPEKNEENKKDIVNPFAKPNQGGFEPPKPSNEFQEVKPKTKGAKTFESKTQAVQSPGIQTKPKEQESPKKPEVKPEVQEQKVVEEKPVVPVKKEVKIEIVIMSREAFADALEKLVPSLKEKRLPENLLSYQHRDIMAEQKGRGKGGQYENKNQGGNSGGGGFERIQKVQQPEPKQEKTEDGGYQRGSLFKPSAPTEPKFSIGRVGLTPEELEMKKKLSESVNVWTSSMKAEKDPEGAFKKDVKFNLNVLTIDNFDVIKVKILKLANQGPEQCKKVAELIIENAWTQKRYVNTYAKLCKFLGEQDSLSFEPATDGKKKKNDFTLQILKQIQHVFEDESNAKVAMKKPFEEMDAEEKAEFLSKKKQKIFGNVSFIGELFLEKVIVIGVVRIITLTLLSKFLQEYETYKKSTEASPNKFYEDTLEGLLRFYEIVGKAIEEKETSSRDTKSKKKEKAAEKPVNVEADFANGIKAINAGNATPENLRIEGGEISLESLFKILNTILTDTGLTPRLDSLVKNLIYRRDNNWQDSIAKDQGPKTMKELHEEYLREQMESERSGAQYKEELRYSQTTKSNKVYTQKNEFQFQVANDNRDKKDERREIENLENVDTSKYSFKPDRSSKKGGDTGDSKAKPKVNYELIKGDLKDIYKLTNGEEVEEKKDAIEELKKLGDKYEAKDIMISFFKTFYDGSLSSIQKRFVVSTWLFENKPQALTEFPTLLSNAMNDLFRELSDFPNLPKYLARIALDYCRIQKNGDILKKINLSESIAKSEEGYDLADMFEKFNDQFLSFLNGEYSDLKNIIAEDVLKDFAKKIQIDFE